MLSLPIGILLAGNQFRLPVRTAFIPASGIEDQSLPCGKCLVESRESIISRPSLLNLYVRLSVHTASEYLDFNFCSCVDNHGRIHVLLQDFPISNYHGFHLRGVGVLFPGL